MTSLDSRLQPAHIGYWWSVRRLVHIQSRLMTHLSHTLVLLIGPLKQPADLNWISPEAQAAQLD